MSSVINKETKICRILYDQETKENKRNKYVWLRGIGTKVLEWLNPGSNVEGLEANKQGEMVDPLATTFYDFSASGPLNLDSNTQDYFGKSQSITLLVGFLLILSWIWESAHCYSTWPSTQPPWLLHLHNPWAQHCCVCICLGKLLKVELSSSASEKLQSTGAWLWLFSPRLRRTRLYKRSLTQWYMIFSANRKWCLGFLVTKCGDCFLGFP